MFCMRSIYFGIIYLSRWCLSLYDSMQHGQAFASSTVLVAIGLFLYKVFIVLNYVFSQTELSFRGPGGDCMFGLVWLGFAAECFFIRGRPFDCFITFVCVCVCVQRSRQVGHFISAVHCHPLATIFVGIETR